jgi:hypothetical protein
MSASRKHVRAYAALTDNQVKEIPPPNMVVASCWCDKHFVFITRRELFDGHTRSCGLSTCHSNVVVASVALRAVRLAAQADRPY